MPEYYVMKIDTCPDCQGLARGINKKLEGLCVKQNQGLQFI
jgi:hypothetical protein